MVVFTFYFIGGVRYYKYVIKSLQQSFWRLLLNPYTSNWAYFIQEWGFLAYSSYNDPPRISPQLFGLGQHDKT
jgi:hypothetical protein